MGLQADCPVCGGLVVITRRYGECCGVLATRAQIKETWENVEPLPGADA